MIHPLNIKLDHAKTLIDGSIVIWFHDESLAFDIQRIMQVKLNQTFKCVQTFTDKGKFLNHLNDNFVVPILQFIISGEHAEELCSLIKRKPGKYDVYELDIELTQSIRKSSNTWFTFSNIDELFRTLFEDLKRHQITVDKNEETSDENECKYKTFLPPLGIFNSQSIPTSFHFLDKESLMFLLFQLLNKIIIRMEHTLKELSIMCVFCRQKYNTNATQMGKIDSFEKTYCSKRAIEYYTECFFLFQSLTEVFQREDTNGIYKFRCYIVDLHKQLKQRYTPVTDEIILYRGKKTPLLVLQRLKDLQKRTDKTNKFISMNGFFSTTEDEKVAMAFAGTDEIRYGYESTIFKLKINKAMITTTSYANITFDSCNPDEREVLFSMGSIWNLLEIENNNNVWMIELELSNKFDDQLNEFDEKLLDDYPFLHKPSNDYYIFLLTKVLYELGRYSQAGEFYNCLLEKKDLSDEFKSLIHLNLATMRNEQGEYTEALKHLEETLASYKLETCRLRPNHAITTMPSRTIILNTMGLLYQKKDDYDNARHSFENALKEQGSSIEISIVYNNLGNLENIYGNTNEAHLHLEKAVELAENSVWLYKFKKDLENVKRQLKTNQLQNQN